MRFAFVTSVVLWSLIIWGVTSLSGCVTSKPAPQAAPAPEVQPEEPKFEPIPFREESPDEIFNREVDACFVEYRKCQATGAGESTCFPPQEKCVITAYRKLKKARGE